jgi:hypothetical protein
MTTSASSSSSGTGVDTSVHIPELPLPFADSYPALAIQARAGRTGDGVAVRSPMAERDPQDLVQVP